MAREPLGTKLARLQAEKQSQHGLLIRPFITRMPLPIQRYDDPFFPFSKTVIAATRDLVCAFVFDMGAYLALGGAGAVALERSIAFAAADAVTILHGPFEGANFVDAAGDLGFNVDAVTVLNADLEQQYRLRVDRSVFVLTSESEVDAPQIPEMGRFRCDDQRWTGAYLTASGEKLSLDVKGDAITYASNGEDFAQAARDALLKAASGDKP